MTGSACKNWGTTAFDELFLTIHKLVGKLALGITRSAGGFDRKHCRISIEVMDTCRFLPGYQPQNDDPAVLTKHVFDCCSRGYQA